MTEDAVGELRGGEASCYLPNEEARKIAFRIARVDVAKIEYGVLTTDLEGHGNQRKKRSSG